MHRGSLALAGAVLLVLTALNGCGGDTKTPESIVHKRPNLVYLVVDDLDQTSTPMWAALPQTKKLIADRGMTFQNNFATDPVCCPARATLLTGMYPHNTNVYESSVGLQAFKDGAVEEDDRGAAQGGRLHDGVHGEVPQRLRARPAATCHRAGTSGSAWPARGSSTGSTTRRTTTEPSRSTATDDADYQTDVIARQAPRLRRPSDPGEGPRSRSC